MGKQAQAEAPHLQAQKKVPTYDWLAAAGILPSNTTTYPLSQIQDALTKAYGAVPYVRVIPIEHIDFATDWRDRAHSSAAAVHRATGRSSRRVSCCSTIRTRRTLTKCTLASLVLRPLSRQATRSVGFF